MNSLNVTLRTPLKTLFDSEADSVRLKTDLGRMEILPGHATLVGSILYSKVYIRHGGTEEAFVVRQGSVSVDEAGNVAVLVMDADKEAELSIESMEEYLRLIAEQLENPEALNSYQRTFLEEQRQALQEAMSG
ncbi:MAG: F0F1 ATP synthase subunit epsilon [bacterium]|nr:F0F1 ATP synthase subunit epsilon [bacterium]